MRRISLPRGGRRIGPQEPEHRGGEEPHDNRSAKEAQVAACCVEPETHKKRRQARAAAEDGSQREIGTAEDFNTEIAARQVGHDIDFNARGGACQQGGSDVNHG